MSDLAPTGKLRLAVFVGPRFLAAGTPPAGVAVDLGTALAARLGVPLVTTSYDDPAKLVAAAAGPGWDVAFLPVNPALTSRLDYGGAVLDVPHTLLVRSGSMIRTLADADQPGVRIASNATDAHTAVLAGQLHRAQLVRVASDDDGLAMLKTGQVDALANPRFILAQALPQVPGARLLADNFFTARFSVAVTKGHPAGLSYLTDLVQELKTAGAVQHALDAAHVTDVAVAPSGAEDPTTTPSSVTPGA
jgi:polar amino acid transport system substrate-binding protein